jgi:hypothetical protein
VCNAKTDWEGGTHEIYARNLFNLCYGLPYSCLKPDGFFCCARSNERILSGSL